MVLRTFVVNLTMEDLQQRAEMLAKTLHTYEDVDAQRREQAKEFREQLIGLKETIHELAQTIETHQEVRQVSVVEHRNDEHGTIDIIRTDTGEVVESRLMTSEERQVDLFPMPKDVEDPR